MANSKLDKLLAEAEKAYQKNDRRKGAQRIGEILKQDFMHLGAWKLLYSMYGEGKSFGDFQRAFAEKYYPDQLHLLQANVAVKAAPSDRKEVDPQPPAKKPSFFARLFGIFKRKSKSDLEKAVEEAAGSRPDEPFTAATSSAEHPAPVDTQPAPQEELRPSSTHSLLQSAQTQSQAPATPRGSYSGPGAAPIPRITPLPPPSAASNQKIRVMVVDDIAQTRENIIRSLRFQEQVEVIGFANNGAQAIQVARQLQPDVIVMDVNMPDMDGITATGNIKRELPATEIIILTVQDDTDYMRQAMLAGARDFLVKPPMIDDLMAAVVRAADLAHQTKAKLQSTMQSQTASAFVAQGKVITVYSPRGGSGCTMLATNLAAVLQKEDTPVIIVDANLQFGDVPVFFNTQGKYSILDLAQRADELDFDLVNEVIIKHVSGIKLLAPPRPQDAAKIDSLQFTTLIEYLSKLYSYVIIDTSHRLSDVTLAAIDASNLVIVVTTQDIPATARLRRFLDLAPALNLDKSRMLVVMNQFDKRSDITPDRLAQALRLEFASVIPTDMGAVIPSINRGTPLMLDKEALGRPIAQAVLSTIEAMRLRLSQLELASSEEK